MPNVEFYGESGSSPSPARSLPADRLPEYIGHLAREQAIALARLVTPTQTTVIEPEPVLLTVAEAAMLVSLSPVALRRSARFQSARRKLSHRTVRFDRDALMRVIKRSA